jgi:hypothetical protein
LALSTAAREMWIRYSTHIERELRPGGELDAIRGLANKLPEHAARLAAVLTLVRDNDAGEISPAEMKAGLALAEHYSAEARRLFGVAQISGDLKMAGQALSWLLGTWPEPAISLPDIYQRGPCRRARDKATAAKIVALLEDHGWLMKIPGGAVVGGERRKMRGRSCGGSDGLRKIHGPIGGRGGRANDRPRRKGRANFSTFSTFSTGVCGNADFG